MPIEKMQKKTQHVHNIDQLDETFETSKEVNLKSVSTPSFMASLNSSFEASAASSPPPPLSFFGCFSSRSKRVSQDQTEDDDSRGDRRYKRKMKNRESAARSRARRQAYTSELEREIVELKEENAMLRKHQLELRLSAPVGISKKNYHSRSMTAPF